MSLGPLFSPHPQIPWGLGVEQKVMAKGTSIKNVGKKMGLMKDKAAHTAVLGGDPFSA